MCVCICVEHVAPEYAVYVCLPGPHQFSVIKGPLCDLALMINLRSVIKDLGS